MWLFRRKKKESAPQPVDLPVSASEINEALLGFQLPQATLDALQVVITKRSQLRTMVSDLQWHDRNTLKRDLAEAAKNWATDHQTEPRLLLAAQNILGANFLHSAFIPFKARLEKTYVPFDSVFAITPVNSESKPELYPSLEGGIHFGEGLKQYGNQKRSAGWLDPLKDDLAFWQSFAQKCMTLTISYSRQTDLHININGSAGDWTLVEARIFKAL